LTNEHACKDEQKAVTFSGATTNSNKQTFPQNEIELLQQDFIENKTNMLATQHKFDIVSDDPEVKATTLVVAASDLIKSWNEKCKAFYSLSSAVRAISALQRIALAKCRQTKTTVMSDVASTEKTKMQILKWAQMEFLANEYKEIKAGKVTKSNKILKLDPFIDENGLLRGGGRLKNSSLAYGEKHSIILPKKSHITKLVVNHCHKQVMHQGRGMTIA